MPSCEPRADYAGGFARALLDPGCARPGMVAGPHGEPAGKRYDVYRNNVTVSLIDALAAVFPATQRITGTEFFRAMARLYVRSAPPTSPLLFDYGRDFPEFIERYPYAARMPWLGDVARLERAWLDAYHAADRPPLAPQALAAVPPERLAGTRLTPHPATHVVPSRFPIVSIFVANRGSDPVGRIEAVPEAALVTRPGLDVLVRRLLPGGAAFLARLAAGAPLARAAEAALADSAGFDLAANLGGALEAGAFAAIAGGGQP